MLDKEKNTGNYRKYLRNINVRWFSFDLSDLLEMRIEDDEIEKYSVSHNDLIICEGGEPGRCAVWDKHDSIFYQKALHRVRFLDNSNPKFYMYYLWFSAQTGQLCRYFTGTGIKHLTGQSLSKVVVPKTDRPTQDSIVAEIESRLSVCDSIENTVDTALQQAEALQQSILKKAFEGMSKWQEESDRHPDEKYTYQYHDYPQTLSVKNQFIADELLSPDNYSCLPHEVIDRILALPKDEAAQDISNVMLYSIGKTYKGINDDTIESWNNSAIMHSLILLAQLQSDKGLDAVLEIMRQTDEFADYHLGDLTPELLHPALYACGKDNITAIEAYLSQAGLDSYLRSQAPDALAMIIFNQPERRGEIIEVFRRLLNNMVSNLPVQRACDGTFAGFVMSNLMDIDAKELIPEIKATFATDCVNKTIAGDCKNVIKDIELGRGAIHNDKYQIPDIYEQYESLKKFITKPE